MGMHPGLPFLFRAALLALLGAADGGWGSLRSLAKLREDLGVHSLHYEIKVFSQDGFVKTGFLAEGYLDGKPCLHYDNEKDKAEPRGPWTETHLGAAMDTETMNLKSIGMDLKATLWDILELQHQKGGFHSLQETLGCEFQKDTGARGFWYYCYDGAPFLSYHPETQRWIEPQSSDHYLASEVKKTWNIDGDKHKDYSHRVQGDICIKLQRFLDSRSDFMERTVSPAVNVTSSEAVEGNVTLTCRATGFYPREISLTWLQDGKPLHVDSQDCGCILSDGNGNYKTWVSTRLPKGEEQRYSCYVEHSGQNSTHPVSHGATLVQEVSWPTLIQERSRIISCFVLGAAVTAVTTVFLFWCHKKQKSSDVESPEEEQL